MKPRIPLLACFIVALTLHCCDNPADLYHGQHVFAIVDVMTLNAHEMVPEGFTGIAFSTCTDPYIPGVTGEFTAPSDVNIGIGGDTKYIWVKYEKLRVGSEIPVLVDIEVAHWPQWRPYYPEGWEPAGPLTTGTWGDCWRNGLNVKYLPLREADSFISTLCLSITENGNLNSCPDSILMYEAYWPRELSALDIHKDCGDDHYVYVSYYRPAIVRWRDAR
jgi:hypothetical protein